MREDGQRICFTLGKTPGAERILLWDDLEGIWKWGNIGDYFSGSPIQTGLAAYDGDYGLQLLYRGDLPDHYMWGGAARYVPRSVGGRIRFEFVSRLIPGAEARGVHFGVELMTATGNPKAAIHWLVYEDRIEYLNSAGLWAEVPSGSPVLAKESWHHWFAELDLDRQKWVAAGVDGFSFHLNEISLSVWPIGGAERMVVGFSVASWKRLRLGAYFDDVLVRRT